MIDRDAFISLLCHLGIALVVIVALVALRVILWVNDGYSVTW